MRARDVARDGEAQARAAATRVLIAGVVEAKKRLENIVAHRGRDARAVVIDGDREPAMVTMAGQRHSRAKARRIGYQIGKATFERSRAYGDDGIPMEVRACGAAVALDLGLQLVEENGHVGWR